MSLTRYSAPYQSILSPPPVSHQGAQPLLTSPVYFSFDNNDNVHRGYVDEGSLKPVWNELHNPQFRAINIGPGSAIEELLLLTRVLHLSTHVPETPEKIDETQISALDQGHERKPGA
jgi:hypothetical protein